MRISCYVNRWLFPQHGLHECAEIGMGMRWKWLGHVQSGTINLRIFSAFVVACTQTGSFPWPSHAVCVISGYEILWKGPSSCPSHQCIFTLIAVPHIKHFGNQIYHRFIIFRLAPAAPFRSALASTWLGELRFCYPRFTPISLCVARLPDTTAFQSSALPLAFTISISVTFRQALILLRHDLSIWGGGLYLAVPGVVWSAWRCIWFNLGSSLSGHLSQLLPPSSGLRFAAASRWISGLILDTTQSLWVESLLVGSCFPCTFNFKKAKFITKWISLNVD